jgi:hypothetical protein
MNEDKKFVYIFYGFIGILVAILSVFLILSMKSSSKKNSAEVDYKEIKAVNPDEDIFSSKSAAYDQVDKERMFDVSEETVNIDFKKLFNNDSVAEEVEIKEPEIAYVQEPKVTKQVRVKTSVPQQKTVQYHQDLKTTEVIQEIPQLKRQGFYTNNITTPTKDQPASSVSNMIRAAVHFEQLVKNSSVVKFRILDPIIMAGITIPVNTIFYGEASISQERVKIKLNNIFYNSKLYPFQYTLYDADGIEGIYVPGMLIHDATKEAKENIMSDAKINIPYVGRVPVNVARKSNNSYSCILTQDYVVYLK